MNKIRYILSVWVCKILIFTGKLTGKGGSSTPGKYALKICPDALKIAAKGIKKQIIITCGTNGKTTSNNLINSVVRSNGYKTVCNNMGANMLPGVATAFLGAVNIFGKMKCDYGVIEVDEASATKVFDHFRPDIIHITNLFRDQLDRYGEIDLTANYLIQAIEKAGDVLLVINGDDPLCNMISIKTGRKTISYGISENAGLNLNETKEGRFCQFCGEELSYNYYHYSQLGDYYCPNCGFKRPEINYAATKVQYKKGISFNIGDISISADYRGFYNIYNILSCYAVCDILKMNMNNFNKLLENFKPQAGRMEKFFIGKPVILNLSKNPSGFNQGIQTVISDEKTKDIIVMINDNAQDGKDISWIWDVDFEKLEDEKVGEIGVTGIRVDDVAVRFKYAQTGKNVYPFSNLQNAVKKILEGSCEELYVLVNYTAIFEAHKTLKLLEKQYRKGDKNGN